MMRSQAGRPQPFAHLVVSDGLSHVSVFVEPAQASGRANGGGASDDSPTSFAVRSVADHQVTVMGDVPFAAVQAIADGVTRRAR
jgi:sigma-E factor negative regulatory protein RseB